MKNLNFSFRSRDLVIMQICLINNKLDNHYIQVSNLYNESLIQLSLALVELQMTLKKKNKFNNEDLDSFTQHIIVENFNIHHLI
jgi:hypothetical protein